jgi:glycosyltransferase involved in cell wall biosynthesis
LKPKILITGGAGFIGSHLIDHQQNGYLAKPYEPQDLAHGIDWILNHPNPDSLSKNARQKALTKFDSNLIAQKHIELYQKVMQ